jgi:hypothetical protein
MRELSAESLHKGQEKIAHFGQIVANTVIFMDILFKIK